MNAVIPLYDELKRFIYSRVRDQQDAEDIVQDVFIKAQLKGDQLKDAGKFAAWLYQITRNAIADHFRVKQKKIEEILVLNESEPESDFNDCVAYCLNRLIVTLPAPYREALELTEIQNIPQKEFAQRLGISYSGAKSRVQRARQMLRDKLNELYKIQTDAYGNVIVCENRGPCDCESFDQVPEIHEKAE